MIDQSSLGNSSLPVLCARSCAFLVCQKLCFPFGSIGGKMDLNYISLRGKGEVEREERRGNRCFRSQDRERRPEREEERERDEGPDEQTQIFQNSQTHKNNDWERRNGGKPK